MLFNLNGNIIEGDTFETSIYNRGLNYGDGVFETMKFANNRINFWEDHYFRLMSSMRILRMEIPMNFSPEYLEEQLRDLIRLNELESSTIRLKVVVTRKAGGYYTPNTNDIDILITVEPLDNARFTLNDEGLEIDMFKDFYVQKSMLSNLKTTSSMLYTLASVFRKENQLDECVLVNDSKHLVETISSNIFLVKDNKVITPALDTGCLKGIIRKKVLEILPKMGYEVEEKSDISPFELQKVDQVFLTNSIHGVRWVKKYRKKEFSNGIGEELSQKLNIVASIG
jgi:branched-chain amino acid aminotransferase